MKRADRPSTVYYNARWAEMLGYRLDELAPLSMRNLAALRRPDDLASSDAAARRHLRGETPWYEHRLRLRHRAGHWIHVQDRGALRSHGADGAPEWMFGTHIDITDLLRAELSAPKRCTACASSPRACPACSSSAAWRPTAAWSSPTSAAGSTSW